MTTIHFRSYLAGLLTALIIGLIITALSVTPIRADSIPVVFTDGIESAGSTKTISFHLLFQHDDGSREWHYFGSTAAEAPPTTGDPVFEHQNVQFPRDFDELGPEVNSILYDIGLEAGLKREGLR